MLPPPLQASTQQAVESIAGAMPANCADLINHNLGGLVRACACSPWLQQTLALDPQRLATWLAENRFAEKLQPEALHHDISEAAATSSSREDLKRALRRIHCREEAIIAWRDLNNLADLEENLNHISVLAEKIVTTALAWLADELVEKHGQPTGEVSQTRSRLTLFAMGKLGGGELNFHSDIDLIAIFDEPGETNSDRPLSNQEFFTRLVRALVDLLQSQGTDGQLYNIDLRLRPFGDSGALVVTADALETYYTSHGREWERYALIKARPVAADIPLGEQLLSNLSPFIYRRYLDYGAFQSLREMKHEIDTQVARAAGQFDVKLGRGGIREIEFIVQSFQLVHGGRDPALRLPVLARVLSRLQQRGEFSPAECQTLTDAYQFLRRSEHRIQMLHHRQHHQLPTDEIDLLRLAVAMGYSATDDYLQALTQVTRAVSTLFGNVLASEKDESGTSTESQIASLWGQPLQPDSAVPMLQELGFDDPALACEQLIQLQQSRNYLAASELARQRLSMLLPTLLGTCATLQQGDAALAGTLRLLATILRRSAYISLLYENPPALLRLCQLCAVGEWVTSWLCQYPAVLDELIDNHSLQQRPDRESLANQFDRAILQGGNDLEQQMNRLRDQRNGTVLRAAMLDVDPTLHSDDLLTEVAELVLDSCLRLAWQQLVTRHGPPPAEFWSGGESAPGILVVGYGKLGAGALSYRSDLDLVLLHPDVDADAQTTGPEPTPLSRFYIRVGQRLTQLLSTQTTSGRLYEVDLRLRPNGNAGPLVSELQSFQKYQLQQAQIWEHQSLVHARPIIGDTNLAATFATVRDQVLRLPRNAGELTSAIVDMRERIRSEKKISTLGDQIKLADGGMLDIEFFSQHLVLLHAADHPALTIPTATIEIFNTAMAAGIIGTTDGKLLIQTYQQLCDRKRQWELGRAADSEMMADDQLLPIDQLLRKLMDR